MINSQEDLELNSLQNQTIKNTTHLQFYLDLTVSHIEKQGSCPLFQAYKFSIGQTIPAPGIWTVLCIKHIEYRHN